MRAEQTGGRGQTAWSDIDWAAAEAVVRRLQDRIYRQRLEPDDEQSCAVQNGELNLCLRQGEPGEVLLGQSSYPRAKAYGDKSMTVKRGFGRTCQTQRPARPARYGQG